MNRPKGNPRSMETRRKMSEAHKGKHPSQETRKKISQALRGENNFNFGKNHSGKRNPGWKGGRTYDSKGYVLLFQPDHPRADKRGYVYEAIIVLEEKLGRPLLPGEETHHANGIPDDNRPENLYAFPSKAKHMAYHRNLETSQGRPFFGRPE